MAWRKRTFKRRPRRIARRSIIRRVADFTTGTMSRRTLRTPMTHSFRRMLRDGIQIPGSATYAPYLNTFSASNIQLANVVNSTDFANLYDQYRINYVVLKIWLVTDPGAQSAAAGTWPKFYWYRDYDDNTLPGSINEIRENAKARCAVLQPNKPLTIKFKPNTLQLLYQSAVASQYKPVFGQWLDMTTTSTGHYGFKYAIDNLTNTNYRVDMEATLYFQCRQPR